MRDVLAAALKTGQEIEQGFPRVGVAIALAAVAAMNMTEEVAAAFGGAR